jgi:ABC-type transport system involved in cytochrome bd biosynthesis fused ATPase/permease subunit
MQKLRRSSLNGIRKLQAELTVIIIAHHHIAMGFCDQVVRLDGSLANMA